MVVFTASPAASERVLTFWPIGANSGDIRVVVVTQQIDLSGAVVCTVAAVMFGLAEIELEYRRERQAAGIAVAKARGVYRGAVSRAPPRPGPARGELRTRGRAVGEIAAALVRKRADRLPLLAAGFSLPASSAYKRTALPAARQRKPLGSIPWTARRPPSDHAADRLRLARVQGSLAAHRDRGRRVARMPAVPLRSFLAATVCAALRRTDGAQYLEIAGRYSKGEPGRRGIDAFPAARHADRRHGEDPPGHFWVDIFQVLFPGGTTASSLRQSPSARRWHK